MVTAKMKLLIVCLFVISNFNIINGYKILFLAPVSSRSHMNVFEPLILQLAKKNHQVTIVSPYITFKSQQNVREILLVNAENVTADKQSDSIKNHIGQHILRVFLNIHYFPVPMCEAYFQTAEVRELLKSGKQFDVVIVDSVMNECALATAPLLGKHVILQSTTGVILWMPSSVPLPLSYVPHNMLALGSEMNFIQRLENVITFIGVSLIFDYETVPFIQSLVAKHLPENPSIWDGFKSIDFTLTNSDPVMSSPRPLLPNIAAIGGMHCRKAKPLPKELEDFIAGSGDNGFIMFSLGSVAQSTFLSEDVVKGLLKFFSSLKQNVIWKYEKKLENLPKNVKISKWLPQKDILGHPKIRLFITHGGLLSLQESIYNAVPVIAIPIFAEQPSNAARIEEIGVGVKLDFFNITGESMLSAINEVLGHKSYAENMKKYSSIFHDFIESEKDKGVFWIEYVIRHNGARHLRIAGEELNFFQYHLIDVIIFLALIFSTVIYVTVKLGKFILFKFCKCKKSASLKVEAKKKQ